MPEIDCPAEQELQDYALGKLGDERSDRIDQHVEGCPACTQALVATQEPSDTLVTSLRQPREPDPYAHEPKLHEMLAAVETIGCDPSFAGESRPCTDQQESLGTIRDYQLLEKLGEGGMGTVYKALHGKLEKVVTLKVLPAERIRHTLAVRRFEQEMRAVGRLSHPNIVAAYDAGEHDGTHFLVMEYVDGVDLSELVHRIGPLPIADACELIRQAAIGLQHAHEHNLVHRDIKPSNLMLSGGERLKTEGGRLKERDKGATLPTAYSLQPTASLKILDLGLARLHNGDRVELTGTGQMMGTVDYMAPEQTGDSRDVDIRADIYSLGATLFKLLCGRAPYAEAKYDTILKRLKAMAVEPIPAVQGLRPEVPDDLAAIIARMLAKEPDDRYATPQEVAEALAPFAEGAELASLLAQYQEAQQATDDTIAAPKPSGTGTEEHLSCSMTETATEKSSHHAPRDEQSVGQASRLTATEPESAAGDRPTDEAVLDGSPDPSIRMRPTVDEMARSGDRPQPPDRLEPGPQRWNRITKIAAVAAGLAALFAAAMVIRVATDKGEIRITSYSPEIEVTVKRNGEPVDGFQVKQRPDGTSYYSGDYEIVIVGGKPDGVKIENETFTLTRGKEVLVEIVHAGQAVPDGVVDAVVAGSPDPATEMTEGLPDTTAPTGRPAVDDVARSGDRPQPESDRPQQDPQDPVSERPDYTEEPEPSVFPAGIVPKPADLPGIGRWNVETARPRGQILSADWSPDGKHIACGMASGHIRIYDAATLKLVRIIDGRDRGITSVAWSPDSKRLASTGYPDGAIRVWSIDGRPLGEYPSSHGCGEVAWHPMGEWIAVRNPGEVKFYGADGDQRGIRTTGVSCRSMAWRPDGEWLAVGGVDGKVRLWKLDGTAGPVFEGKHYHVDGLSWSPDGTRLASAGYEGKVKIWDSDGTMQLSLEAEPKSNLSHVAWSSDGTQIVVAGSSGQAFLWALDGSDKNVVAQHLPIGPGVIVGAARHQNKFFTAGRIDGDLRLWKFDRSPAGQSLGAPLVFAIDCSPTGSAIASGGEESGVRFWQSDGRLIELMETHDAAVTSIAWNPDGKRIASSDLAGELDVYGRDGTPENGFPVKVDAGFRRVRWNRTGDRLAATYGHAQTFAIWDSVGTRLCQRSFSNQIRDFSWSLDGKQTALVSSQGASLWTIESEQDAKIGSESTLAATWNPRDNGLAFSTQSDLIITGGTGAKKRACQRPYSYPFQADIFHNLSWDPAGQRLLGISGRGRIGLWSSDGTLLRTIWAHGGRQQHLLHPPVCCWTHDGKHFLSAAFDGTIRYYQADPVEPQWIAVNLPDGKAVTFSPTGEILHGDTKVVEEELVYLVESDDGTLDVLTPAQFQERVKSAAADKDASTVAPTANHP